MNQEYMNLFGSRKREQARQAAQEQDWQHKYPLTSNAGQQAQMIQQAQMELNTLSAEPAHTAGAKRVKDRQIATLNAWISSMKNNLKDLQVGVAPAVTSANAIQSYSPVSSPILPNAYSVSQPISPSTSPIGGLSSAFGLGSTDTSATQQAMPTSNAVPAATNSKKKIIFIAGGIVAAAIIIALVVKKKK